MLKEINGDYNRRKLFYWYIDTPNGSREGIKGVILGRFFFCLLISSSSHYRLFTMRGVLSRLGLRSSAINSSVVYRKNWEINTLNYSLFLDNLKVYFLGEKSFKKYYYDGWKILKVLSIFNTFSTSDQERRTHMFGIIELLYNNLIFIWVSLIWIDRYVPSSSFFRWVKPCSFNECACKF